MCACVVGGGVATFIVNHYPNNHFMIPLILVREIFDIP